MHGSVSMSSIPDLLGPSSEPENLVESPSLSSSSDSESDAEPVPPSLSQQVNSLNPTFLPNDDTSKNAKDDEQVLKERFCKFWMAFMVQLKKDLKDIQKVLYYCWSFVLLLLLPKPLFVRNEISGSHVLCCSSTFWPQILSSSPSCPSGSVTQVDCNYQHHPTLKQL